MGGKKGDERKRKRSRTPEDTARPTVVPPVPSEELARKPEARRTPGPMRAIRESQPTITDEAALEQARIRSMDPTSTPAPSLKDALETATRQPPALILDPAAEMDKRFTQGDFSGALEMAESVLANVPDDAAAMRIAADCRTRLIALYEAQIGSVDRVPHLVVARDELRWLAIDHRAGFLLSHIDGVSSVETILDVSGMPRLDSLRILAELLLKNVVALR